jgi:hypothetical protein
MSNILYLGELLFGKEKLAMKANDKMKLTIAGIKFVRRKVKCAWTDYKRNEDMKRIKYRTYIAQNFKKENQLDSTCR